MKRLIATIVILTFAVALMATESDPSETVGFYKIDADIGYTPFALPFTFYIANPTPPPSIMETMELDDIIGDQLTAGMAFNADKLWDINEGWTAYLNQVTGLWTGTLADSAFTLGHAYYIENKQASSQEVYLAGTVDQSVADYGLMDMGFNPVGVREAGNVLLDDIDLLSSGFTGGMAFNSDKIWDLNNGTTSYYNTMSSSWVGFDTLTIGHAYYIQVKNTPFTWVYDPGSKGGRALSKTKVVTPVTPKVTPRTTNSVKKISVKKVAKPVRSSE